MAPTILNSGKAAGSTTQQDAENGSLVAFGGNDTRGEIAAAALNANRGCHNPGDFEAGTLLVAHTLRAEHDATEDGTGRGTPIVLVAFPGRMSSTQAQASIEEDLSPSLTSNPTAVAFQLNGDRDNPGVSTGEVAFTIPANPMSGRGQAVAAQMAVRRLTPVECCRLQGFPDDYLDCLKSDGPKYKALGNSMATNVIRFIGDRINLVRAL